MIENTSHRAPEIHHLGHLSSGYVESMEADGSRQLVASAELMPKSGPWAELQKLGFSAPESTDDELFVKTTLPVGWAKQAGRGDARGSVVVDGRGVERVGVFYKAAYYDRKADCYLMDVGGSLATRMIYSDPGDEGTPPPGPPPLWEVLTADEQDAYVQSLLNYLAVAAESPSVYGDRVGRVEALMSAVASAAG